MRQADLSPPPAHVGRLVLDEQLAFDLGGGLDVLPRLSPQPAYKYVHRAGRHTQQLVNMSVCLSVCQSGACKPKIASKPATGSQ